MLFNWLFFQLSILSFIFISQKLPPHDVDLAGEYEDTCEIK
jgi:hypothetical protein